MIKPKALGYLRRDISGARQGWDEAQIRSVAAQFGFDLCKILAFGPETDRPVHRIGVAADRVGAGAVVVPSSAHFDGGEIPSALTAFVEVITVSPEQTFPRGGGVARRSEGNG